MKDAKVTPVPVSFCSNGLPHLNANLDASLDFPQEESTMQKTKPLPAEFLESL